MTANAFGNNDRQEVQTPEGILLETAERVARIRAGRAVVHVHLSQLLPQNRDEARIRIAARLFESMVDAYQGQMFVLTNYDIVLLCKDARIADLDAVVFKLRALFAKDPLTYGGGLDDRFATFYELDTDYDDFLAMCTDQAAQAKKRLAEQRNKPKIADLDASTLGPVMARIAQTDIAGVVRRQPCVYINDRRFAQVVFQEFYMSIADLQKVLAPDINLLANRWLFMHLSQALDLSVMSALKAPGLRQHPVAYSLNLNMASTETPQFNEFIESVKGHSGVYVEFQLTDVVNNLDLFFRTRDRLKAQQISTVLDGMNALSLQFVDAELYDTDFVKVNWAGDMSTDIQTVEMQQALAPVGFDRVILARCDSEDAVSWGLDQGIRLYQGRFLDSMVAAVTLSECAKSAPCSLAQCITRHGVISGRPRAECGDNDKLDEFPPLRSFG